jgi:hypothetical protein
MDVDSVFLLQSEYDTDFSATRGRSIWRNKIEAAAAPAAGGPLSGTIR